jgi:hypothetical protein
VRRPSYMDGFAAGWCVGVTVFLYSLFVQWLQPDESDLYTGAFLCGGILIRDFLNWRFGRK